MKKLIFPLLLMLAIGMLAAVESDPSNVVGYVKYPCAGGLNSAIALPMDQAYELGSEVGDGIGATTVGYWDPVLGLWMTIDSDPWGGWSDEFDVANGDVLVLYVDDAIDFFSIGNLPAVLPSNSLTGGLNSTLMVPLNRSDLTLASGLGDEIEATTIGYWDPVLGLWMTVDSDPWGGWSDDFDIAIGDGLIVYVDDDITWPAAAMKKIK